MLHCLRQLLRSDSWSAFRQTDQATEQGRIELGVESLEARQMLAGNVNMNINGAGDLILNGDGQDNDVEISMVAQDGQFVGVVRGLNGTSISLGGTTSSSQFFELVESNLDTMAENRTTMRDVRVSLGGGDDSFRIVPWLGAVTVGVNVGRDLRVNLGAGEDHFEYRGAGENDIDVNGMTAVLGNTFVFGDARVSGQAGDDLLELSVVTTHGTLDVNTGPADDSGDAIVIRNVVGLAGASLSGGAKATSIYVDGLSTGEGDLSIRSGGGIDEINLARLVSGGDTRLDLGSNNGDPIELMFIGNARLFGDLDVTGTGGRQRVLWTPDSVGFDVQGDTNIRLGGGDDELILTDNGLKFFDGDVAMNLGGGNDQLTIEASTFVFGNMSVALGGGNDEVLISGAPAVSGDVFVNGGAGSLDEVTNRLLLVVGGSSEWISIDDTGP